MLEYLSSELTDSATVTRARDMMTDDAEETSEEIRQQEQEHIFAEIVKVTQSTVDKYVDDILLQTIYSSAHEDTLLELGVDPEQVSAEEETGAGRRQSTGDTGAEVRSKESRMVRQRMRTTQKK